MSVTVRPYRRGGWEVDIQWRDTKGVPQRERRRSTVTSKSAAQRWGEARERELLLAAATGTSQPRKEVPTLAAFAPRFVDGYARAERQKPSTIHMKEAILRRDLLPQLGTRRLDAITDEDVQQLKYRRRHLTPASVNNVLTVLSMLLKKAVEWKVIDRVPCTLRLLRRTAPAFDFWDFSEFDGLVAAAQSDPHAHLVVLLGGEAGLRAGEIRALEWTDIDFRKRQVGVARSDWRGQVQTTKGNRVRYVPLTRRLAAALQAQRHLRGPRVLSHPDGRPLVEQQVIGLVAKACRRANLRVRGPHVLRHTFCSHLAMRGAPARAIQELAGHRDLVTTQRYMHLSPAAVDAAIRLLEQPAPHGDIVETAVREAAKD